MKKYLRYITLAFTAMLFFASCQKEENRIYFEGGTPPVLTASTTNVVLQPGLEANTAVALSWTNPDYEFTTGVSSHDVNYTLEIDTLGGNFSSGVKYSTVIAKDLEKTYTVNELNSILGNTMLLQLNPRREYTLEMRVIASIGSSLKLASNTVAIKTTPFSPPPKVEPPAEGNLWVVGDAFAGGWDNPIPSPYDGSQKFTKVSNTIYELTVNMKGGGGYKLIQKQGDWGSQYHMLDGGTWESGTFEKRDSDPQFPGAPSAGTYKITIDFQLGKYTVVKQ